LPIQILGLTAFINWQIEAIDDITDRGIALRTNNLPGELSEVAELARQVEINDLYAKPAQYL
jgi:hypothetical protein